jgi:hypothetical protein
MASCAASYYNLCFALVSMVLMCADLDTLYTCIPQSIKNLCKVSGSAEACLIIFMCTYAHYLVPLL